MRSKTSENATLNQEWLEPVLEPSLPSGWNVLALKEVRRCISVLGLVQVCGHVHAKGISHGGT